MPWFLNPYVYLVSLITGIFSAGVAGYFGYQSGVAKEQAAWNKEKLRISNAVSEELVRVRQKEADSQKLADRLRREKNESIQAANATVASVINRLQDRPKRGDNATVSEGAVAGQTPAACDGSRLYREDGEFLIREAAIAKSIQAALRECYGMNGD